MSKKRINIGLDLGIGSVGWAVVNHDEFEIIDAGIRLFPEANQESTNTASTRREKRSSRRMNRRSDLRLKDTINLFIDYGFIKNKEEFYALQKQSKDYRSIAELKQRALSNPITLEELLLILYHTMKKRGSFNLKEDLLEDFKKEFPNRDLPSKGELDEWAKTREVATPSKLQLDNFNKNGQIVGGKNKFPHQLYEKELEQIISNQPQLDLSKKFIEEYFDIFNRKRKYWAGPGFPSEFGWNGDQAEFYNRLIGKDTYNRLEDRTAKKGMYANLFNMLNDLNNLTIDNENRTSNKLNYEEKMTIIKNLFPKSDAKTATNLKLKSLAKTLNITESDISGYRIDKKSQPNFTKFEGLNDLFKTLKRVDLDTSWLTIDNIDLIDDVLVALTKYQTVEAASSELTKILSQSNIIENSDKVAEELAVLVSKYNGSHALSKKTIKLVLPIMWKEPKNSMQIFKELNIKKQYKFEFDENVKYIPVLKNEIQELFISPVVKRTMIQALKVLKEIQIEFKDYEIVDIIIELARENNSEETRKFLTELQSKNENSNKEIRKFLEINNTNISPKMMLKTQLFREQDGRCPYCLRNLDRDILISNESAYEVDHIIPESISFNTKRENLVLVHQEENHKKSNRSAYEYITSMDSQFNSLAQFDLRINEIYQPYINKNDRTKYFKKKIAYLKDSTDFADPEKRLEFINRNLQDTRYSTSELRTYLFELREQINKKNPNNPLADYKLKVMNGSFTDFLKKTVFDLPKKDRDDYKHHGIDAITIAYSDIIGQELNAKYNVDGTKPVDLVKRKYAKYGNEIQNFNYHFSRKTNHNANKQLTKETLYSFKKFPGTNDFKQMSKVTLLGDNTKVLDDIFINKKLITPMELNDPKTFDYLKSIYNDEKYAKGKTYIDIVGKDKDGVDIKKEFKVKNPFSYFVKETKTELRLQKNTKHPELNPVVKSLRYYGNNMGKLLDMSKNYCLDDSKTKVGFTSLNPIRLDIYQHKTTQKYEIFPVNVNVVQSIKNDELIINQEKYEKVIQDPNEGYKINLNQYEKVLELFPRGSLIRVTTNNGKWNNQIFEVVGAGNVGKIEVDFLTRRKQKDEKDPKTGKLIPGDPKRIMISKGTIDKIEKVNVNILGTKMNFVTKEKFDD